MPRIKFPYGRGYIEYDIPDERLVGLLVSGLHRYRSAKSQEELVREAMEDPIGTPRLRQLAIGKKHAVILASDHTRPVPSKIIMPLLLAEIRAENPAANITILIATGCHRETTKEELIGKFGEEIVRNEHIVIHDCDDTDQLVHIGTLPSGGECVLNRIAYDADLLIAEGFIEPHFFAGFSGGRKSVLPGVAGRSTVLANHCAEFIAHPCARTGVLANNPIHDDMMWAARAAKLAYIVNVVVNAEKEAIYAVAGDMDLAHRAGCEFLAGLGKVDAVSADIAIATNGGYPLDQNIYQAVKGMTAAEATVKKGGVIVMLAKSNDGHGGDAFYRQLSREPDLNKTLNGFMHTDRGDTLADQWQSQVLIRVLQHAAVIYVSDAPDSMVQGLHMMPAHSVAEAFARAEGILQNPRATVTAIPDGVSVIVTQGAKQ